MIVNQSFSSFAWGVSEEKIKMWKVNGRRKPSDGKSSHCLWQDELKREAVSMHSTTQPKYDELANCIHCRYENYWRECFFLMHRHTIPKLAINENQNNHKFDYKSTVWSHLDISKHQFIQFTTQNWRAKWSNGFILT